MTKKKITQEQLRDARDAYWNASCKPTTQKYSPTAVIDENKSVKWNREEVIRRNEARDEEVKELNRKKNKLCENFIHLCCDYIQQETTLNEQQAHKAYEFLRTKCDGISLLFDLWDFVDIWNS